MQQQASRHRVQQALRRRRLDRVPSCLQARMRGHRVEAPRLPVPVRPIEGLDQDQEPGITGGKAGGRGGVA